ncbi:MAG: hypothetical protein WBC85_01295 [Planktotalea sp.]
MKQSHADFSFSSDMQTPELENDQALAAMFGVCILVSIAMWVAFFCWLF